MKQAILFDMDGTLIDSMPFWLGLKTQLCERYFLRTREKIVLSQKQKEKIDSLSMRKAIKYINSEFSASMSYKLDCVPAMAEFYRNECKIKPGVKEALEYFKAQGIKMAVCTATPEKLARIALRAQGIEHYFKFVMTPEKSKSSKARPIIFKMCAMKLFKMRKNIVLIDDAPYALKTAKAFGMRAVGIIDGMKIEETDCHIIFEDFYKILEHFIKEGSL